MKKLFIPLLFLCPSLIWAQSNKTWVIVPDDDISKMIAVENISFLISADNAATFSVVCNNGVIASNITSASFKETEASAIKGLTQEKQKPGITLHCTDRLALTGCLQGSAIHIYAANGRLAYKTVAAEGTTTINIASLAPGTYIVKVGNTAAKFIKK